MKENPLTVTVALETRYARARERERAARAEAARLRRSLSRAGRRVEAHRLCVLGAALVAWCQDDADMLARVRERLRDYVSRDTDRAALRGTPYDVE